MGFICRDAVTPILGSITDSEVQDLQAHVAKLVTWQAKLAKLAGAGKKKSAKKEPDKATDSSGKASNKPRQAFGDDLEFHCPRRGPLPDEAMPDAGGGGSGQAVSLPPRYVWFVNS